MFFHVKKSDFWTKYGLLEQCVIYSLDSDIPGNFVVWVATLLGVGDLPK